eukprot:gene7256-5218_t
MESIEKVEGGANHIAIPEDGMSIVLPSQKDAIEILYKTAREAYFASNAADNKASPWFPLVYIGCMVKLKLNQELFYLGHQLVNSCPNDAVSWYCVGCYYFSCGKLDFAHRYIKRCLKKDPEFFLGWLMLGHILSLQEESEQAVAAYRSAVHSLSIKIMPTAYGFESTIHREKAIYEIVKVVVAAKRIHCDKVNL